MTIEIKVSLGDYYVITTQENKELAIKEARQTVENEYGYAVADSAEYTVEGEGEE